LLELFTIIGTFIATVALLMMAVLKFLHDEYTAIHFMVCHDKNGFKIIIENNGNKNIRLDEIGIYIAGKRISMCCDLGNISPLKRHSFQYSSLCRFVTKKLEDANTYRQSVFREKYAEFKLYIRTSNKIWLTRIWISKNDLEKDSGSIILDLHLKTYSEKVDMNYHVDSISFLLPFFCVAFLFSLITMLFEASTELDFIRLLCVTLMPILIFSQITRTMFKTGKWYRKHAYIMSMLSIILYTSAYIFCVHVWKINTPYDPLLIFFFLLIMCYMFNNFLDSVVFKENVKKYKTKECSSESQYDVENSQNRAALKKYKVK
jgi:hypothetical protein